MFRTALRNVLAHKAKLLMTALAVTLGVAFVAGSLVFSSTVSRAYSDAVSSDLRGVDLAVQQGWDDGPHYPDQRLLDEIAALPETGAVLGDVRGNAALAGPDGQRVGELWSSAAGSIVEGDERRTLVEGRLPEGEGELLIDSRTAERTGFTTGDTVTWSTDGPGRTATVTGVFDTEDGDVAAGGTLLLFAPDVAQEIFLEPGQYDQLNVTAAPGVSQGELRTAVEPLVTDTLDLATGDELVAAQERSIASYTEGLRTGLLIFAGISLFVGIFIIANTFTMLVTQRIRELALLRAVGASRRQVTRSVLIESFVVGFLAGATGLVVGIGVALLLRATIAGEASGLPAGDLVVGLDSVLVSLGVGVVVTMLSAWLPARRAAKIPPAAAVGAAYAPATRRGLVVRTSVGAVLTLLGGFLALVKATDDMSTNLLIMTFGSMVLLTGVILLTPVLSRPVIAAVRPLLRPFGFLGDLARRNALRDSRRTAATASALMIGLTLITALTVGAAGMQRAMSEELRQTVSADYEVRMFSTVPMSPEVREAVAAAPEVTASTGLAGDWVDFAGEEGEDGGAMLHGVNGADLPELMSLELVEGESARLGEGEILLDERTAAERGLGVGDSVALRLGEEEQVEELTVVGVYGDHRTLYGMVADVSVLERNGIPTDDRFVWVMTEGGVSAETTEALRAAVGDSPALSVLDREAMIAEASGQADTALTLVYALLGMAVVIAVLGVVNTLAMSVMERRSEIGMLRAVGLDRGGVARMVRLESVVISLFGGVLGIGLGIFIGWAGGLKLADQMTTFELVLPYERLGLFLLLAAVVGVIAALWPARRAARTDMLSAIHAT
ncbi:ABC transporter permease [Streptomyces bohaiensis]|uniref:ABC transporter permease n=1 Tax=Streptomyces bohaiensis TaxID=1431344 RepID=A0ABX1CDP4_9ACTN|nr:ABC transporter permease [Streptomyces bohaiensis]NJQ14449.1 ABC transporter permease [Streptomyces bohaiensis]